MAIQVQCSCGRQVRAADEQAGRKVRCPSCRALVRLPGEPAESAGHGVERVRQCPGCRRQWPLDAVVCIDCGHHFETGRRLRTTCHTPDRVIDDGVVWLGSYTRYRLFRGRRGQPCLQVSRKFLFLPLGSATYNLSDYQAIRTDFSGGGAECSDVFYLELEGPAGRAVTIFRSSDEEKFKELLDLVAQAGRLEIKRR
jgi:hypothetical protein